MSFHVGRSPTRFYIIVGRSCSHVINHNLLISHILAAHGHGLVDFHVSIEESLTYKCQSHED